MADFFYVRSTVRARLPSISARGDANMLQKLRSATALAGKATGTAISEIDRSVACRQNLVDNFHDARKLWLSQAPSSDAQ
jgi:hypothetical protein